MLIRLPLAAALAAALLAAPAAADPALDRLFDDGQLATVPEDAALVFDYDRANAALADQPAIEDGAMTLGIDADAATRVATVRLDDGTRERPLGQFPGEGGNPLLLIFLENVSRAVSEGTGGSPFYIKNRIKDAFRAGTQAEAVEVTVDGETVTAERIAYAPFANETQTARLGLFADLELVFVVSDAVPGRFVELSAASTGADGAAYTERLVYAGLTGEGE